MTHELDQMQKPYQLSRNDYWESYITILITLLSGKKISDTGDDSNGSRAANGPGTLTVFLRLVREFPFGLEKPNLRVVGRSHFLSRIVAGPHRP